MKECAGELSSGSASMVEPNRGGITAPDDSSDYKNNKPQRFVNKMLPSKSYFANI